MANTNKRTVLQVGEEISGSTVRLVDTEFRQLPGIKAPLASMISTAPASYLSIDYKLEWIRMHAVPHMLTLDASFTAASDTTLTVVDANIVMVNQILAINDQYFRVTAHNSDTELAVEKSAFGSTAANLASGDQLNILLPTYLDNEEFKEGVKHRGEFEWNFPMLLMEKYGQTDVFSSTHNYLTKQQDQLDWDLMQARTKLQKQLEATILYGTRRQISSSNRGMFHGIKNFISTNHTVVSGNLSPKHLIDTIELMAQWDEEGVSRLVIGNANTKRIWDSIWNVWFDRKGSTTEKRLGITVDTIDTNDGTYEFLRLRQMRDSELYFVKMSDIQLVPIQTQSGSGWMEHEWDYKNSNKRMKEKGISNVLSLKLKDERVMAKITGFSSDLTGYDGIF